MHDKAKYEASQPVPDVFPFLPPPPPYPFRQPCFHVLYSLKNKNTKCDLISPPSFYAPLTQEGEGYGSVLQSITHFFTNSVSFESSAYRIYSNNSLQFSPFFFCQTQRKS